MRMISGHQTDEKTNAMEQKIDRDFLANIETLVLDQAEAFVFQNMDHLDEVLSSLNQKPKKLTQINDITRLKDIYTHKLQNQASGRANSDTLTYSALLR